MKNYLLLFLTLILTFSCKQKNTITVDGIIQRFDELTEFSYNVDQIWSGPIPGSIDSLSGHCSFIKQKNDTLIGAHYLFSVNYATWIYNGNTYIKAAKEDKSAVIYNLDDYPNPFGRVTTPMLYLLSYNDLMQDLKERLKYNPKNVIILKDTILNSLSRFRLKIAKQDTIIDGNHNENYVTIIFNKETLLPLVATKTQKRPGEVHKEQTINANFSDFQVSTTPTNRTIDLSSIPYQILKLSYAADNPADSQNVPSLRINDFAPSWKGITLNGDSLSSKNQIGKITLLDFTSVHCGPCRLVDKVLSKIDEKFKNLNLSVISVYPLDKVEEIRYLTEKSNINHFSILNASQMQKDYLVAGFPNLFLINESGKIKYISRHYKEDLETELTMEIDKLIPHK